jgi:hypothetical protein
VEFLKKEVVPALEGWSLILKDFLISDIPDSQGS